MHAWIHLRMTIIMVKTTWHEQKKYRNVAHNQSVRCRCGGEPNNRFRGEGWNPTRNTHQRKAMKCPWWPAAILQMRLVDHRHALPPILFLTTWELNYNSAKRRDLDDLNGRTAWSSREKHSVWTFDFDAYSNRGRMFIHIDCRSENHHYQKKYKQMKTTNLTDLLYGFELGVVCALPELWDERVFVPPDTEHIENVLTCRSWHPLWSPLSRTKIHTDFCFALSWCFRLSGFWCYFLISSAFCVVCVWGG